MSSPLFPGIRVSILLKRLFGSLAAAPVNLNHSGDNQHAGLLLPEMRFQSICQAGVPIQTTEEMNVVPVHHQQSGARTKGSIVRIEIGGQAKLRRQRRSPCLSQALRYNLQLWKSTLLGGPQRAELQFLDAGEERRELRLVHRLVDQKRLGTLFEKRPVRREDLRGPLERGRY